MYAEGGDFGYSNRANEFWPYFGCSYLGDGVARETGNVQSLTGLTGTFADGMTFGYPYQGWPDSWVDEIGENGGTLYLRCQSGTGRAISYEGANYRTIFSAVTFGALRGTDRSSLMSAYVDYLLSGLGIEEGPRPARLYAQAAINPVARNSALRVHVAAGLERVGVLDASGRTIAELATSDGTASWDMRDRAGSLVPAGTYFLRATGTAGCAAGSFVVLQ